MGFRVRRYFQGLYVVLDALVFTLSFLLSYFLRYRTLVVQNDLFAHDYLLLCSIWFILLLIFLNKHKLYVTDRMLSAYRELSRTFRSVLYSAFSLVVFMYVFKIHGFSRVVFTLTILFCFIFMSLWRMGKRLLFRYLVSKGYRNLNVLIVGVGNSAEALVDELEGNPYLGLRVKGFLDDQVTGDTLGYKVLGSLSKLEKIVRSEFIDEIIVTIPSEREKVKIILHEAARLKKSVRVLADNYDFKFNEMDVYNLGVLPLLAYHETDPHGSHSFVKRIFDIISTGFGLILLSPLFLVIAMLIKLDSKGSVFYVSRRSGLKGKVFDFIKFRTMLVDAETQKEGLQDKNEVSGGKIFKIKDDPRITKVGKILRKYSLDELPQLFNVFIGDMSIVGPRPFPVEEFSEFDYFHMARAEIKPGITGLAQIRGRSDLSFYRWVKWDLWYINNWSFWLDLVILWRTLPVVIKGRGAY